jgi:hypothetical protein
MAEEERSLEQTPTWAVAAVATVFVLVSLLLERGLHRLGKVKASLSLSLSLSLSVPPRLFLMKKFSVPLRLKNTTN